MFKGVSTESNKSVQNFFSFLLGLGLFYVILNIGSRAAPYVGGDEVFLTTPLGKGWDESPWTIGYIKAVQGRYFLAHYLRKVFQFFGGDLSFALLFFQGFFLGAVTLLFLTLKRYFSQSASIFGSLAFLTYVGKYEILNRYEGAFYHFVIFILALCVYLFTSEKIKFKYRMIIISLLLWLSLHFYEVLLSIAPFFPLFVVLEAIFKKEKVSKSNLLWSTLPLLLCFVHIGILAATENPIWTRNGAAGFSFFEKTRFLLKVFSLSLSSLFGPRSYIWNFSGLDSFLRIELVSRPLIGFLVLAGAIYLYRVFSQKKLDTSSASSRHKSLAVWGLVMFIVTPMISLPIVESFVPSRFTYVASFMLAFPLAYGVDFFKKWHGLSPGCLVLVFILFQAMALSGINAQLDWAGRLDEKVGQAVRAVPLDLKDGDAVFVSIPYDPKEKHYQKKYLIIAGQYVEKHWAETLWADYPKLKTAPLYRAHLRRGERDWKDFLAFINHWRENSPNAKHHFIYLDDFYRPWRVVDLRYKKAEQLLWSFEGGLSKHERFIEHRQGEYRLGVTVDADFQPQKVEAGLYK